MSLLSVLLRIHLLSCTKNLGVHTKRGSGLIVMGVGGGAWYPPAQGALADATNTRHSYLVPVSGYIAMTIYAVGLVVDQSRKNGFSFRNRDELTNNLRHTSDHFSPTESLPGDAKGRSSSEKKVFSDELVRVA
ncbi:uncharacterized protein F5891DRAFT_1191376 [Suillus fuscotomentosus]|uniref:Uncharacterized protein n=1 Tax=Suillus fuscotomentosus TaxID=1912939 RepID=A0AAD4E1M1_9AGAM|nr:uncharacterized protein F5891DRAFT_1191376 [Suillus fuscotomentosus]KAG1898073.1 hypothetical protein F5891DRAFT_1191376 [Suillus fuscotomentosus]